MHTKVKRLVLLVLTLALLFGAAGQVVPRLHRMRVSYNLTNEPVKGVSPQLVLATQALGWGRGIIIDVIWIRMEALKEQGRYFELVQLAQWACALAPRIPQVWDVQAWNMAYNVSCQIDYLPDRWAWVWKAVELLRDQGIPDNPDSAQLYESLAMTFFHKIGEQEDFANPFYKQNLATMMQEVLGGGGDEKTLEALAAAPRTRVELLQDPDVRRLVDQCTAQNFDVIDGFFQTLYQTPSVPDSVRELIARPENAAAMAKVATFARSRKLRETYKMDPQLMIDLSKTYKDSSGRPAPFDWRSPFPHAIYWASVGVQKLNAFEGRMRKTASEFGFKVPMRGSRGLGDPFGAEPLYEFQRGQLERIIYVAMQSLVNHGRILFDMNGNIMLDNGPDYRFADAALPLYEKYINSMDERYASGARDGFQNFLTNGVVQFSVNGDNAKAQQYYKLLCQNFPDAVKPYKSYDAFLEDQFRLYTSAMTFSACRNLVRAYVNSALIAASLGDDEDAVALENEGKKLADHWVDRENNNLRGLIDYEAIKNSAIVELFTGKMQMAPQQLQLLKKRIGETAIDRIVKAATEGAKKAPTTEKASAQMQQNNTIKPDLDAPQYH